MIKILKYILMKEYDNTSIEMIYIVEYIYFERNTLKEKIANKTYLLFYLIVF